MTLDPSLRPSPFIRSCPVCGYSGEFRAHPRIGRANATCPGCGGRERHRMLALYLAPEGALRLANRRVLHISPETILERFMAGATSYETSDPELEGMDHRFDITQIPIPGGLYDAVLCNHVLEHVVDDRAALSELYRILAPGGLAVITLPVIEGWEKTYEDPAIDTPELRELYFGRYDHVRYYGRDIRDRIRAAGFALEVFQPTPQQCVRHAITRGHSVFVGHKRG